MPITNRESLQQHLQTALELEHATIPAYLAALYSLHEGKNTEVAQVIQSVVMEEMLHMTLVANILNAVSGTVLIDDPKFIPEYPGYLPHSDESFLVGLLPFTPEAIDTFLRIERPAPAGAPPEADDYETIGQFYEAIEQALKDLAGSMGEGELFNGDSARQVRPEHWYYGGGGEVVVVTDLASAKRALEEVKEQGEGIDHTIFDGDTQFGQVDELAHYFRFNEIRYGRRYLGTDTPSSGPRGDEMVVDWQAVHPATPNPKATDFADQPEVHALMVGANRTYTRLLEVLHQGFSGKPDLLLQAVPVMYELKYAVQALMKIPSGRGDGRTVGFGFEYWR
jgi:rubrerythrin